MKSLIVKADARHLPLPDKSVHCVVTSPPYWGMRVYKGNHKMIGMEETWKQHLENLRAVFAEVWRVLRNDGTFWLNYGDRYASGGQGTYQENPTSQHRVQDGQRRPKDPPGVKPKDLLLMPEQIILALREQGWYVRSKITWHKPNPRREYVMDRPTKASEDILLLAKRQRYYYDHFALLSTSAKGTQSKISSVWTIPIKGIKANHFATYPEELPRRCIRGGTSSKGVCSNCGAQWKRRVTSEATGPNRIQVGTRYSGNYRSFTKNPKRRVFREGVRYRHAGWKAPCKCNAPVSPAIVLDPFVGSGTTCRVATQLSRLSIGCDLDYQDLALRRTKTVQRDLVL